MGEMRMTRDFFLWCMACVYMFAFTSLYVQIPGLYGENGILPAKLVLQKEAASFADLVQNQPTLLRLLPKLGLDVETSMDFLALGGIIISFVAMVSRTQRNKPVFLLLWAFYFSLFQVGQTFMWFQWDILLMEAGFLCLLVAPLNIFGFGKGVGYNPHDNIMFWLVKWLMFRLMFASGVVKLTSGCPTWWGLTALDWHYESQCIPTPLAWYFHHLPKWFNRLSVAAVYMIEIILPVLFFSPVRFHRLFAFYAQIKLMILIVLTGNYNFFNLLTCVLALSVVDDNFLRKWMGKKSIGTDEDVSRIPILGKFWRPMKWVLNGLVFGGLIYWFVRLFKVRVQTSPFAVTSQVGFTRPQFDHWLAVTVPITIWIGVISLSIEIIKALIRALANEQGIFRKLKGVLGCLVFGSIAACMFSISLVDHTAVDRSARDSLPPILKTWHDQAKRYELMSSYGLFRSMTGVGGRPEVVVEGSDFVDKGWKEYNFLYKPGNLTECPPVVAPHQPRLDWQMWFAALGSYQHNNWFLNLAYRILTEEPTVMEIMGKNPYKGKPPKYIRALLYTYHYTSPNTTHEWYSSTDWWVREKPTEYLPIITKDDASFVNYLKQAGIYKNPNDTIELKPIGNVLHNSLSELRMLLGDHGQLEGFLACLTLFVLVLCVNRGILSYNTCYQCYLCYRGKKFRNFQCRPPMKVTMLPAVVERCRKESNGT